MNPTVSAPSSPRLFAKRASGASGLPNNSMSTPLGETMIFSADETTDVGYESGTTVSPDLTPATSRFRGRIDWVQIDVGKDDHDHLIDPDERLKIVMARQ